MTPPIDKVSSQSVPPLERRYRAGAEEMWELWTTVEGIESWWGPPGFAVKVLELDLQPGGVLRYTMTATGAEQADYVRRLGIAPTTETRAVFTRVERPHRLAFVNVIDFVPGEPPYEAEVAVSFAEENDHVRLTIEVQAMHDPEWTARARAGWEGQLLNLEHLLDEKRSTQ